MRLLTQFLTEARKKFARKQQDYRDQMLCAAYAREVKLDEARAIVQSSVNWGDSGDTNRSVARAGSLMKANHPPPCFSLFSDPNTAIAMEALVRHGVQLTLEGDPELRSLVTRQQEHRMQTQHPNQPSPRRPSVSFSGAAVLSFVATSSPLPSSSPRTSILKKSPLPPSLLADKPATPTPRPVSGKASLPSTPETN